MLMALSGGPQVATTAGMAYQDGSTLYAAALNQTRSNAVLLTATKSTLPSSATTSSVGTSGSSQPNAICYVGPEGGTYTLTTTGQKNYGGCAVGAVMVPAVTPATPVASGTVISPSGSGSRPTCYVGPNGGTYTITANGNKNYSGC